MLALDGSNSVDLAAVVSTYSVFMPVCTAFAYPHVSYSSGLRLTIGTYATASFTVCAMLLSLRIAPLTTTASNAMSESLVTLPSACAASISTSSMFSILFGSS